MVSGRQRLNIAVWQEDWQWEVCTTLAQFRRFHYEKCGYVKCYLNNGSKNDSPLIRVSFLKPHL